MSGRWVQVIPEDEAMSEIPKRPDPYAPISTDEYMCLKAEHYEAVSKVAVEALREIAEHDGSWADAKTALAKIEASGWKP